MAGPASQITANPKVDQHLGSQSTPALTALAGAAVTVGAILKDNGSGLLIHATAATDEIVGIAGSTAAASGDPVSVIPWFPGIVFEITADDGTTTGATTAAATDRWTRFGFGIDSGNGRFFLNLVNTTDTAMIIVGLVDAAGTTRGKVLASPIFNPAGNGSVWAA